MDSEAIHGDQPNYPADRNTLPTPGICAFESIYQ